MYERYLRAESSYVGLRAGARLVRGGGVALVGDSRSVAKQLGTIMTSQELCSVRYSKLPDEHSQLYSAARRGWPLAELLKRG